MERVTLLIQIGKVQDYGAFLQAYPYIFGTDVAGEVYETGEGVTHVKKGDCVLGFVSHMSHIEGLMS